MSNKNNCPVCDGVAKLVIKKEHKLFRKERFEIYSHFYKCDKCEEEFTTTATDNLNINQVYNQYREYHNMPLPDQFKYIRNNYGLSAAKMSMILGLGTNQWSLYEKGDIPNESNSQLIELIFNPENFKVCLKKRKKVLEKDYDKIVQKINKAVEDNKYLCNNAQNLFFNPLDLPDEYNGYQMPSIEKFANIVIYFLDSASLVTRLNKFLFYADFLNFKRIGHSISGYNYAAIPLGPVPQDYKTIYDLLEGNKFISTVPYESNYETTEKFVARKEFDRSLFSDAELTTLETVINDLSTLSTDKIIKMSHEEIGWQENVDRKRIISYQKYGFKLKYM